MVITMSESIAVAVRIRPQSPSDVFPSSTATSSSPLSAASQHSPHSRKSVSSSSLPGATTISSFPSTPPSSSSPSSASSSSSSAPSSTETPILTVSESLDGKAAVVQVSSTRSGIARTEFLVDYVFDSTRNTVEEEDTHVGSASEADAAGPYPFPWSPNNSSHPFEVGTAIAGAERTGVERGCDGSQEENRQQEFRAGRSGNDHDAEERGKPLEKGTSECSPNGNKTGEQIESTRRGEKAIDGKKQRRRYGQGPTAKRKAPSTRWTGNSQANVFECTTRPLCDALLQGYNATVLAYGQTGSGKTYTIVGPSENPSYANDETRGLLPRALQYLFSRLPSKTKAERRRLGHQPSEDTSVAPAASAVCSEDSTAIVKRQSVNKEGSAVAAFDAGANAATGPSGEVVCEGESLIGNDNGVDGGNNDDRSNDGGANDGSSGDGGNSGGGDGSGGDGGSSGNDGGNRIGDADAAAASAATGSDYHEYEEEDRTSVLSDVIDWSMELQFVEIYQEHIYDLLSFPSVGGLLPNTGGSGATAGGAGAGAACLESNVSGNSSSGGGAGAASIGTPSSQQQHIGGNSGNSNNRSNIGGNNSNSIVNNSSSTGLSGATSPPRSTPSLASGGGAAAWRYGSGFPSISHGISSNMTRSSGVNMGGTPGGLGISSSASANISGSGGNGTLTSASSNSWSAGYGSSFISAFGSLSATSSVSSLPSLFSFNATTVACGGGGGREITTGAGGGHSTTGYWGNAAPLKIRYDSHRHAAYVAGARKVPVHDEYSAMHVFAQGLRNRRTAETRMNLSSSRSHAVFSIQLHLHKREPQELILDPNTSTHQSANTKKNNKNDSCRKKLAGQLHIVDLAGSERQRDAASSGDRLREAGKINYSLSVLSHVIRELAERSCSAGDQHQEQQQQANNSSTAPTVGARDAVGGGTAVGTTTGGSSSTRHNERTGNHIPYRDSKLTFLLMDALGGSSKVSLIATVSCSSRWLNETISTLQFAALSKKVKNKAIANEERVWGKAYIESVLRLHEEQKAELERLRQLLQEKERCAWSPSGSSSSDGSKEVVSCSVFMQPPSTAAAISSSFSPEAPISTLLYKTSLEALALRTTHAESAQDRQAALTLFVSEWERRALLLEEAVGAAAYLNSSTDQYKGMWLLLARLQAKMRLLQTPAGCTDAETTAQQQSTLTVQLGEDEKKKQQEEEQQQKEVSHGEGGAAEERINKENHPISPLSSPSSVSSINASPAGTEEAASHELCVRNSDAAHMSSNNELNSSISSAAAPGTTTIGECNSGAALTPDSISTASDVSLRARSDATAGDGDNCTTPTTANMGKEAGSFFPSSSDPSLPSVIEADDCSDDILFDKTPTEQQADCDDKQQSSGAATRGLGSSRDNSNNSSDSSDSSDSSSNSSSESSSSSCENEGSGGHTRDVGDSSAPVAAETRESEADSDRESIGKEGEESLGKEERGATGGNETVEFSDPSRTCTGEGLRYPCTSVELFLRSSLEGSRGNSMDDSNSNSSSNNDDRSNSSSSGEYRSSNSNVEAGKESNISSSSAEDSSSSSQEELSSRKEDVDINAEEARLKASREKEEEAEEEKDEGRNITSSLGMKLIEGDKDEREKRDLVVPAEPSVARQELAASKKFVEDGPAREQRRKDETEQQFHKEAQSKNQSHVQIPPSRVLQAAASSCENEIKSTEEVSHQPTDISNSKGRERSVERKDSEKLAACAVGVEQLAVEPVSEEPVKEDDVISPSTTAAEGPELFENAVAATDDCSSTATTRSTDAASKEQVSAADVAADTKPLSHATEADAAHTKQPPEGTQAEARDGKPVLEVTEAEAAQKRRLREATETEAPDKTPVLETTGGGAADKKQSLEATEGEAEAPTALNEQRGTVGKPTAETACILGPAGSRRISAEEDFATSRSSASRDRFCLPKPHVDHQTSLEVTASATEGQTNARNQHTIEKSETFYSDDFPLLWPSNVLDRGSTPIIDHPTTTATAATAADTSPDRTTVAAATAAEETPPTSTAAAANPEEVLPGDSFTTRAAAKETPSSTGVTAAPARAAEDDDIVSRDSVAAATAVGGDVPVDGLKPSEIPMAEKAAASTVGGDLGLAAAVSGKSSWQSIRDKVKVKDELVGEEQHSVAETMEDDFLKRELYDSRKRVRALEEQLERLEQLLQRQQQEKEAHMRTIAEAKQHAVSRKNVDHLLPYSEAEIQRRFLAAGCYSPAAEAPFVLPITAVFDGTDTFRGRFLMLVHAGAPAVFMASGYREVSLRDTSNGKKEGGSASGGATLSILAIRQQSAGKDLLHCKDGEHKNHPCASGPAALVSAGREADMPNNLETKNAETSEQDYFSLCGLSADAAAAAPALVRCVPLMQVKKVSRVLEYSSKRRLSASQQAADIGMKRGESHQHAHKEKQEGTRLVSEQQQQGARLAQEQHEQQKENEGEKLTAEAHTWYRSFCGSRIRGEHALSFSAYVYRIYFKHTLAVWSEEPSATRRTKWVSAALEESALRQLSIRSPEACDRLLLAVLKLAAAS